MPPKKDKEKTIEETYKKMTQREHVLHRSGMYIGSINKTIEEMWVFDDTTNLMKKKMVEFTPGFLKIFDEILTNALDHSARDATVDKIKVDLDQSSGEITVWNNGTGIPVVIHKEHNIYIPELIFGNLLSSSNYNDNDVRTGAGTNGLGSKVTSIYSKRFVVETVDSVNNLKFIQEYSDNMSIIGKPKITKNSSTSYTKITFLPDYPKFGMRGLEKDTIALIKKRVYDCIACTNNNVSVFLNGERLKGKGLGDYVKYFFNDDEIKPISETIVQKMGKTELVWEYTIVPYSHFEHVSFVNGNSTYAGGKHVDHIVYQITNRLKTLLETKKKIRDVKPMFIKERMFLFLRATVVNPQFNSQTKENLTTPVKDFGCKIEVSDKFIDRLWKSSIIDDVIQFCKLKETMALAKTTDGSKKNKVYIPKLEDALWAGTAKSDQCTLILTEGDSAKTFALWGRAVVGPERFGVFPLKGKVINIRDATIQQLINNEEINNIKQILGLKQEKEYKSTSDLRYGKVMILTDADADGAHIKGLLINFIHALWPSLIKLNFIQTLQTPIVKAIRGKNVIEFFTQQDYEQWKESTSNASGYQIKYYKGLGTSTKEDAKSTFTRINDLQVEYYYKNKECDNAILLAFEKDKNINKANTANLTKKQNNNTEDTESNGTDDNKVVIKCSDKRKEWLGNYNRNSYIRATEKRVSYQDFIHKDLIHFSIYDNLRSIPSLCDGLKPSQRKILYYMLNKNITRSIKVAQLSGYVSAETSYHHGEASLQQAIIGMAQNFVGSNNINLLYPDGNHGSRLSAKDAASPRYIFTRLEQITQRIFHSDDSPLLTYLNDDGQSIEPEWFIPVIPMVLVNGCEGIGTGYSTYIPPHNPKDIIANIKKIINGQTPLEMMPYYRGFNGEVKNLGNGSYASYGKWIKISDTQIKITELPVGVYVTQYKEFLEGLIPDAKSSTSKTSKTSTNNGSSTKRKKPSPVVLKDVENKTLDENTGIEFLLHFKDATTLSNLIKMGTLEKELKLVKMFSTNNMYLFDDNLTPLRYETTNDILLDFCDIRLEFYEKRKRHLTEKLKRELEILESKVRFIREYIDGELVINRKSKREVIELLKQRGYKKFDIKMANDKENDNNKEDENNSEAGFDYLIKMQLVSLTKERIEQLENQTDNKKQQLESLTKKTEQDLWNDDLEQIIKLL
jgi:DNA topoisomerase II